MKHIIIIYILPFYFIFFIVQRQNRKSKCSNADKTVSTTLKIGASKNQGSGEYVHQGTSTLQEKIDATATIDLSNVEF